MAGVKVAREALRLARDKLREKGVRIIKDGDSYRLYDQSGGELGKVSAPEEAMPMIEAKGVAESIDYRGSHKAPAYEEGVKNLAYNMEDVYPSDVYQPDLAAQYYGHGDKAMDLESLRELARVQGDPDASLTAYRAVPKGVTDINEGDWVTLSPTYARQHGEGPLGGDYDIISKKVRAKDIVGSGDSIHEYGYSPGSVAYSIGGAAPFAGLAALAPTEQAQAAPFNPASAMAQPYTAMDRLAVGYPQEVIPAKFPVLGQIANAIDGYKDPTGVLFDTSGTAEYLRRFGEGGTFGQRLGRAFGALPF